MNDRTRNSSLLVCCALSAALVFTHTLPAHASTSAQSPATHNLTLANVVQSVDAHGRLVFVATVRGDLAGVLTLALVVGPNGVVKGGEWAFDASHTEIGAPSTDGDGDPVETFSQLGFLKGTVSGGSVGLEGDGLATDLSRIQLNLTGATVKFAGTKTGSGSVSGANMKLQKASNGFLTISF